MAGIAFDDLVEKKKPVLGFDDLVPQKQSIPQGNAGGAARAIAYGVSGGQVPFAQSITSGIGAGIAKIASPITGDRRTIGELYNQAMDDTRATQAANPMATLGGNVLGIGATIPLGIVKTIGGTVGRVGDKLLPQATKGLINAIPAGLSKVGDFVRGGAVAQKGLGQVLLRSTKAGAVAAPIAGLYGAGDAESQGDRLQQGIQSAGVGFGLGATLPAVGAGLVASAGGIKNIAKGIGAKGETAIADTLGAIKDNSRSLYKIADDSGVLAKPEVAQELVSDLSGVVKNKDIASQKLYSGTIGALSDLADDVATGNTGLMTLDRHRQILGNLAKDITNPNKAQEAEAASRAIDIIDNYIERLSPDRLQSGTPDAVDALLKARKEWSKSKKFEKIGNIIVNASGDANKLKRDLEKFRTNKKNTLGWSANELNALKEASTQTTGEGMLKLFGKFGFDLGSGRAVGNTALPILGSIGTGIGVGGASTAAFAPAATVAALGTAARAGQKAIAAGKAENLLRVIEQGGKVTKKMVDDLPPAQKKQFISKVMSMPAAKAAPILNNKTTSFENSYLKKADDLKTLLSSNVVDINKPQSFKNVLGFTPRSLGQFIKENGGLQDYAGELKARDIGKQSVGLMAKGKRTISDYRGVREIDNTTDYVKQKAFDEGYFPDKNDYNEITDSEFYDAIARDVGGQKIYTSKDLQYINDVIGDSDLIRQYDSVGINYRMTKEEIAQRLKEIDDEQSIPF